MPKRKQPNQPKKPKVDEVVERKTQEKADLVAQSRRPPDVSRFLERLRQAVGRVLDLADAAAEALTKALQPRA